MAAIVDVSHMRLINMARETKVLGATSLQGQCQQVHVEFTDDSVILNVKSPLERVMCSPYWSQKERGGGWADLAAGS